MLDEKELEQISEIVKRTKERDNDLDGCGIILCAIVVMLALWGLFCLLVSLGD